LSLVVEQVVETQEFKHQLVVEAVVQVDIEHLLDVVQYLQ
jgi:hypothetical protein